MNKLKKKIDEVGIIGLLDTIAYKVLHEDKYYKLWQKKNKIEPRKVSSLKMIDVYIHGEENKQITIDSLKKQYYTNYVIIDHLEDATNDHILILESGYELDKACLQELVLYQEEIVYFDEDIKHKAPLFKCDYNHYLLRSYNYVGTTLYIARELVHEFDSFEGFCYELLLKHKAIHIAQVLGTKQEFKHYVNDTTKKVLEDYLGNAIVSIENDLFKINYPYKDEGISIIIPNKDHKADLQKCIESIKKYADVKYEIIIVENNSETKEIFDYYKTIDCKIIEYKGEFNYARINNIAVKEAKYDTLYFLNNDVELLEEGSLSHMYSLLQQDHIGIVGNKLYYPDGTIQHAGVIIGLGGLANHAFMKCKDENSYMDRAICTQNYLAVTAASMMVRKEVFNLVNGFSEAYKVTFNDIDLCLKVIQLGYDIVFDANVKMIHYESKSRGLDDTSIKARRFKNETVLFKEKWQSLLLAKDPYYSKHLSLLRCDFRMKILNEKMKW